MNNNPTYYDDLDDVDEMSGYREAQRQAAKAHARANKNKDRWSPWIALALLIALMWLMGSCYTTEAQTKNKHRITQENIGGNVWLYVVDGHEYLSFPSGGVVHKYDCKTAIHHY